MTLSVRYAALPPHGAAEPVGLDGVLADLDRQARLSRVPGSAVEWGLTWEERDGLDPGWMPQGLTTSADADAAYAERRLLLAAWYRVGHRASRVSVLDLATLRYRHVELVRPTRKGLRPLRVHAGGLSWHGDRLLVAATTDGLGEARLSGIVHHEGRWVLPVTGWLHAEQDDEEPLRYSFCSVEQTAAGPRLLVGEYGAPDASHRVVALPLDADGLPTGAGTERCGAVELPAGPPRMQGLAVVHGVHHATSSHGTRSPGHLHVGRPGDLRTLRGALPPGPEDLAWWPQTGMLWSQSEHPGKRYVFALRPHPA